jgi:hypothetical protein
VRSGEADAVRQARDAALWLGVALAPLAGVTLLMGALTADFGLWLRWLLGPALAALLLLLTLCFALLAADRVFRRFLRVHASPVGRLVLIGGSLVAGLLLVAGLPATWPVVIGFGVVCLVLGALVVAGAALDL